MLRRLLLSFLVPCVASWIVTLVWQPLARHQSEEYFELAQAPAGESSLFRPPGYITFLRGVGAVTGGLHEEDYLPVYLAQGVVLGLASVGLFLLALRWLQPAAACLLALAFGIHPLAVILTGYVHYDLLHLALLIWLSLAVVHSFGGEKPSLPWASVAGVLCALTTLTRPMTLIFPLVLAIMIVWNGKVERRRAWMAGLVCLATMLVVIAPRTWSNYQRTGRFIPINAQSGAALWPMTETALHPTSENFPWVALWEKRGPKLLREKLGADAEDPDVFMRRPVEVDDILRQAAIRQLRAQPGVYLGNVFDNVRFFWTGDSRLFVRTFLNYQFANKRPPPATAATNYFSAYTALLHLLGAFGLVLAVWRKEKTLIWVGAVFLTLWLAHSVVYLDARYLYAELPFLLCFASYGLREIIPKRWPRDLVAGGTLTILSILGLVLVLLGPEGWMFQP
ncbi:MAG TPA: DUF2142 domain-containing protein [Opitutales bacterium]|jgi:hypothetical protein|nr:DUF2142 domain-containing protein [Opitutales bacterium]